MKKYGFVLFFAALVGFSGGTFAKGAKGLWVGEDGMAKMKVAVCEGDTLCAKIIWLREPNDKNGKPLIDSNNGEPRLRQRPIMGLPVAYDMKQTHSNKWAGRVYDPKRGGQTYTGYLTLLNDGRMQVQGCLGFLCQSEYWRPLAAN